MKNLEKKAWDFAEEAHMGVVRKFSGKPYFNEHVVDVYNKVKKFDPNNPFTAIAALLHDTVEDVDNVTYDTIKSEFGIAIADIVQEVTSNEEEIKRIGKAKYLLQKMINMSDDALLVKLCDRLSNISDLMTANEKFRQKYYKETRFIIDNLITNRKLNLKHKNVISHIEGILDEVNSYYKYERKLNYLKLYEDYKVNNIEVDDIIKCIKNDGVIYTDIVKDFPDNDPDKPTKPVSVEDDGLVTVEIDSNLYEVDIKNITKIEY